MIIMVLWDIPVTFLGYHNNNEYMILMMPLILMMTLVVVMTLMVVVPVTDKGMEGNNEAKDEHNDNYNNKVDDIKNDNGMTT